MGEIEKEVKKKRKRENLQKIILNTIEAVGVIGIAMVAPNVLEALKTLGGDKNRTKNPKYVINESIKRLKNSGLIYFEKTEKGRFARLTEKGEKKLRQLENYNFFIEKPKRWDGKWRIIIFDIKEYRKGTREKLRQ